MTVTKMMHGYGEKMTEEWVLFWYQCLSENIDYSSYCSAAARDDKKTCASLEEKFPLLPELLNDFGPPLGWPREGISGDAWKEWFAPRRHLFIQEIEQIEDGVTVAPEVGYALLRVPLQPTARATLAMVRDHLDRLYATAEQTVAPPPKYKLHMRGRRIACGYEQVRQAVHTSTVSYAIDKSGDYVSLRTAIVNFLRGELDNMGWRMSTPARAKLMKEGGDLDEDTYEKFRVRVNKCRRDFEALSQNAIHGRFPDTTRRSDSEVMDHFWGE